jgi:hypothetical protein
MKTILKRCAIYRNSKGVFIFGYLRTPFGGIGVPPIASLPLEAKASEIGDCIAQILNGLTGEVESIDLADAASGFRANLSALGFKSPSVLEKKAAVVEVEFDGLTYSIIPTKKYEHGGNLHERARTLISTAIPPEVGAEVLSLLTSVI